MSSRIEGDGEELLADEIDGEDAHHANDNPTSISETDDVSEIDPEKMGEEGSEYLKLKQRKANLMKTAEILDKHDVVVQKLINKARDDLVWKQYMKCDGLPDPVCVRELNTYLSLWKEDTREDIDSVLERTLEVLPIMSTLENLIENPDEWEVPDKIERESRNYKSKVQERQKIFNEMKRMQLQKLNRATYNLLLDVSPMVDTESNVLQHFLTSELVSLGLWGNVMAKNMRVKGTNFESLGFGFELPQSLMGTVGAVRVMRVFYDHYSPMCKSNKIPPVAARDVPTYFENLDNSLKDLEQKMQERKIQMKKEQIEREAIERAREEEERERARLAKLERKTKTKAGVLPLFPVPVLPFTGAPG